jgi:outer membrane lipoprotein SlyB
MTNHRLIIILVSVGFVASCASTPPDRYNTQKGAVIGAGVGALAGQAIGRNTEGTLIGAGVGTLLGAIIGNAVDQNDQAAREAAMTNKRIVYYDNQGGAVEALPGQVNRQTDCRKVTKRVWDQGNLVSETVEEICEGEKSSSDY